ncbi:MAG: phosphotransferase enzyme family protein [Geminicoccaceae bacterium]
MQPEPVLAPIDRAVATALPRWGCSRAATACMINHSENVTYRVDDPQAGRTTVLRLHRPGYHSLAAIRSELLWLDALRGEAGVITANTLSAQDGATVQTLAGDGLDEPRHAVMFSFLTGAEPSEAALLEPFERLGEVTARLHAHARRWPLPDGFARQTWNFDTMLGGRPIWGDWRAGMGMDAARQAQLQRLADAIERRLRRYGQGPDRFGLIHADLRLANLLLEGPITKVIDFDDCGFGWYLYDLAAALSFIEHRPDVPELVDAWLRGYRRVAPLAPADEAEIPTFILLRRLLLVAWIGSHAETDLAQSTGQAYTESSCTLAEQYLARIGEG